MKTVVHRVTAWLLACTLALGLAACGDITPEDAETYIQGLLDASYLGQYDQDYLDLAGITEEESREEDPMRRSSSRWTWSRRSTATANTRWGPPASWTTAATP